MSKNTSASRSKPRAKKLAKVLQFPSPAKRSDYKAVLADLLDAFTGIVNLEAELRPFLKCEVLSGRGVGPSRCRYANLHPTAQKMCPACAADEKLDKVMSKLRDAVR